ncbi:MAG: CHAT domain-containing protein [Candidatus Omnitrophica bacterium]|nr:Serine/threonine-protein kinase PknD [bacterium]NUN95011.1 CHAT domain-containing protein [Candidatus Omnitrophota bacterium]
MPPSSDAGKIVLEVLREHGALLARCHETTDSASTLVSYEIQPIEEVAIREMADPIWEILNSAASRGCSTDHASQLQARGKSLFGLLLPEKTRQTLRNLAGGSLLFLLDEKVLQHPWELLHDGQDFLCCRFAVSRVVRTTFQPGKARRAPGRKPCELLLVTNPTGDLPLASEEGRILRDAMIREQRLGLEWYNSELSATVLLDLIPEFDAVHFSGHGTHDPGNPGENGWLCRTGFLSSQALREHAEKGKPFPTLVFNNACRCGEAEEWDGDSHGLCHGMASEFLRGGTRHYIGAIAGLTDHGGREFAVEFYRGAFSGRTIGESVRLARLNLRSHPSTNSLVWAQYVLYGDPEHCLFSTSRSPKASFFEAAPQQAGILTVLLVEVVGAQTLLEENGVVAADEALQPYREVFQEVLSGFDLGMEMGSLGHFYLFAFQRPSEAVLFALISLTRLRDRSHELTKGIDIRIGIHFGEVVIKRNGAGGSPPRMEGPAVRVAESILRMARAGQILLSRPVFDMARGILSSSDLRSLSPVAWLDHGAYRLSVRGEPIGVGEVGEKFYAPLVAPENSSIATRYISPDQESVLGWRPALNQPIPTSPAWTLVEKLGSGAFGEVWRADNNRETRVFKFCFREDRVRALKREATLFQLLKGAVGNHPRIVQVFEVYFEEPPYYIGLEDCGGVDLAHWLELSGGCERVPPEVRIEIVIQIAEALQAAHDAGVIHRDVKPSNVLVIGNLDRPESIQVKLTDFGIGQVVSRDYLASGLAGGFTETFMGTELATAAGNRIYMAPEILVGKPPSIRSDIYSLGIVLYQLLIGDMAQPLGADWSKRIEDPLLAEDLARCLASEPGDRFESAGQIAHSLRALETRRSEQLRFHAEEQKRRRRSRWMMVTLGAGALVSLLSLALGVGLWGERQARLETQRELYLSSIGLVQKSVQSRQFGRALELLSSCPESERNWEWGHLLYLCEQDVMRMENGRAPISAMVVDSSGTWALVGDREGALRVWDLVEGESIRSLSGVGSPVLAAAITSDNRCVAVSREDGAIQVWETATWKLSEPISNLKGRATSLAFQPRTNFLAVGVTDTGLTLWNLLGGELIWSTRSGSGEEPVCMDWSRDGKRLAAAFSSPQRMDSPHYARIYSGSTGEEIAGLLQNASASASSVRFSADDALLGVGATDGALTVWDLAEKKPLWTVRSGSKPILAIAFHSGGGRVMTGGGDGLTRNWEAGSGTLLQTFAGHTGDVSFVSALPGCETAISAGTDGTIRLWSIWDDRDPDRLKGPSSGNSGLALSSGGEVLLAAFSGREFMREKTAFAWDPWTGKESLKIESDDLGTICTAPNPRSNRLYTGGADSILRVWETPSMRFLEEARISPEGIDSITDDVRCLSISGVGDKLLAGLAGGKVSIWRTAPLQKLAETKAVSEGERLTALSFSANAEIVAYSKIAPGLAAPAEIHFLDGQTLQSNGLLRTQQPEIDSLAFSPDGTLLLAGGAEGEIECWKVEGFRRLFSFAGHSDRVRALAFASDGTRLFSGSSDKSLKVWELLENEARELVSFEGAHSGGVTQLAYDPSSRLLVSGGMEGSVNIWPAFPWSLSDYPGERDHSWIDRKETYKRSFWRKRIPRAPKSIEALEPQDETLPNPESRFEMEDGIESCTDTVVLLRKVDFYLRDTGIVSEGRTDRGAPSFLRIDEGAPITDPSVRWYVCWPAYSAEHPLHEPRRYTDRSKQKNRVVLRNAATGRFLAIDGGGRAWMVEGETRKGLNYIWTIVQREAWEGRFGGHDAVYIRTVRYPTGYLRADPSRKNVEAPVSCSQFLPGEVDTPSSYDRWELMTIADGRGE